jgi:hypothetical protein
LARSTITSIFISNSAPRRRLNLYIEKQLSRIHGDWDTDLDAAGKIEGAIAFAEAGGLFGSDRKSAKAATIKLRKEINARLNLRFEASHVCLNED